MTTEFWRGKCLWENGGSSRRWENNIKADRNEISVIIYHYIVARAATM
jgi:hypothetical protein